MTKGNQEYNDKEMLKMQREAINRVNEMQRRAKKNISGHGQSGMGVKKSMVEYERDVRQEKKAEKQQFNLRNLSTIAKYLDQDAVIIIILILILSSERYEDKIIILALMYILLDFKI